MRDISDKSAEGAVEPLDSLDGTSDLGADFTLDQLEERNATTLASIDSSLELAFLEVSHDIDAYFGHHDAKPAPAGWADARPRYVDVHAWEHEHVDPQNPEEPLTRLKQLQQLSAGGNTTTLAYNAGFAAAFKDAAEAEHDSQERPKSIWKIARASLRREIRFCRKEGHDIRDIWGEDIHHLVFPKREYRQHVTNPEMLVHCPSGGLKGIGTGDDAHDQYHQVFGGEGEDYKRRLAWTNLDDPVAQQVMSFRAFLNHNDQVPLGDVGEAIRRAEATYDGRLGYAERHFERKVALDTETTGFSPAKGDKLVEIAAVELLDGVASGRTFHTLLDPERHIPANVVDIHGIDDEKVAGMPTFPEMAADLRDYIGESPIIVHNARFDMSFVNAELENAGRPPIDSSQVIDTLAVARKLHPGEKNNLDALCERYDVYDRRDDQEGGHGALVDAKILADLYGKLELADANNQEQSHDVGDKKKERRSEEKAERIRELQAARKGDPDAQYRVGMMYAWGRGVKEDPSQGAFWIHKAAEQGKPQAQRSLGAIYAQGLGVKQDFASSAIWTQKAAEQGDAVAQFNLGAKYLKGLGVERDERKAASWYQKAAEQGHSRAQSRLKLMYKRGHGRS